MRNTSLKWIVGLLFAISQSVSAAPITDVVVVGSQQWAQVNLFTNNSWNEINTQCPSGVCGALSKVNGWDLIGWTWASIDSVQELFNSYTARTDVAPFSYGEIESAWAPLFLSHFGATTANERRGMVRGWSSTPSAAIRPGRPRAYSPVMRDAFGVQVFPDAATTAGSNGVVSASGTFGAWMVRPATPVPLPATLSLFCLGLATMWVTRRKRGAKV